MKRLLAVLILTLATPAVAQQVTPEQRAAYYQSAVWRTVVSDTGQQFKVDVAHVRRFNNGYIWVEVTSPAAGLDAIFNFDCQGHFQILNVDTTTQYAAPGSVVGKISALACTAKPG